MNQDENDGRRSRRGFLAGAAGATAAVGAGGSSTALAQEGDVEEVVVGPDGSYVFDPEHLQITPGTTVHWVWDSSHHDIIADEIPEEASWEGHPTIEDEGFETEHTFEVEGEYAYFCSPHLTAGMEAVIEVGEDLGDGGAGFGDTLTTLLVGAGAGLVSTLLLVVSLARYGRADEE